LLDWSVQLQDNHSAGRQQSSTFSFGMRGKLGWSRYNRTCTVITSFGMCGHSTTMLASSI
jgi:hypothetical protein